MKINDWPMAAALGTILLVMSLVFMAITFTLIGRTGVVKNQPSRVDRVV